MVAMPLQFQPTVEFHSELRYLFMSRESTSVYYIQHILT